MKIEIYSIIVLCFLFFSCEKIDLERNNPLDNNSTTGKLALEISEVKVVHEKTSADYKTTFYLLIYIKNTGAMRADKVTAKFKTKSSYISSYSPKEPVPIHSRGLTDSDYIPIQEERFGYSGSYPTNYTMIVSFPYGTYSGSSVDFEAEIYVDGVFVNTDTFSLLLN